MLNEKQQAAVKSNHPAIMCVACPGSGKTTTLIARISRLIQEGVSPYEIMAFTFTRASASEMKARLIVAIGQEANHVTIGTMHSVCLQLLRRFAEFSGLVSGDDASIYGEWEEDFLLKDEAATRGYFKDGKWKKVTGKAIKKELLSVYAYQAAPSETPAGEIVLGLKDRLRENNALTHGEILIRTLYALDKFAQWVRISHVFCDENQDNDQVQRAVILEIARLLSANVFLCGDIDQSIYSFRGANPSLMLQDMDTFEIHSLDTNYRSAPEIVDAANRLIFNNVQRYPGLMYAARKPSGPDCVQLIDSCDSAKTANVLNEKIESGTPPESIAVLSRTHGFLGKLSRLLEDMGIVNTYIGKQAGIFKKEGFCRLNAMLRMALNPIDNFAFALSRKALNIGDEAFLQIRHKATMDMTSHFTAFQELGGAYPLYDNRFEMSFGEAVARAYEIYMASPDSPANITEDEYNSAIKAKELADEWIIENPAYENKSLSVAGPKYLEWLSFYSDNDDRKKNSKGIQLMTIHASKGLEFPVVFIVGMNEDILPSKQAQTSDDLESERRLAYVAMTRAEDELFLCVRPENSISDYGKDVETPVSRFVLEALGI